MIAKELKIMVFLSLLDRMKGRENFKINDMLLGN
jgi:hypothetical protein